jgi:hypothetical protein
MLRKPCNLKSFVLLLIFSCKIVNLTFSISAQFSKPQSLQEYVRIGNTMLSINFSCKLTGIHTFRTFLHIIFIRDAGN